MASASRGAPVTATALLNVTVTSMVSPRSNVSPTNGSPIATAATPAGPRLLSTRWFAASVTACVPSPRLAAPTPERASFTVPPLSASAPAAMLTPSGSASPSAVSYRNTSSLVPVPDT